MPSKHRLNLNTIHFFSFHFIKLTLILIFMRKIYVLLFLFCFLLLLLLHPNNKESNVSRYQSKRMHSDIFNIDKYLLHHIRIARVEGSGSIYRT